MSIYSIVIGILAAVILFLNLGVNPTAFCAGVIILLIIIVAVQGSRRVA